MHKWPGNKCAHKCIQILYIYISLIFNEYNKHQTFNQTEPKVLTKSISVQHFERTNAFKQIL